MSKRANKNSTPKIQPSKTQQPEQQVPPISDVLLRLGTQMDKIKTTYSDIVMQYENMIKQWIDGGVIDKAKMEKFNAKLQQQQQQNIG